MKIHETNERETAVIEQLQNQLKAAESRRDEVNSERYLQQLEGTLGADWISKGI